jgi:ADP-ribose pyrophosphatase YjhB (NUDIX family)
MEQKFVYDYPMPAVTTDCAIFSTDYHENVIKVLLIKRKNEPYKDCWALPGGFLEQNETVTDCCVREILEETGIDLLNNKCEKAFNIGIYDKPDRDPRQRVISMLSVATICYHWIEVGDITFEPGDDAIECKWVNINELNEINLAFDHKDMLRQALAYCGAYCMLDRNILMNHKSVPFNYSKVEYVKDL